MKEYKELVALVLSTAGMRSQMVVNYLKDVSTMLDITSAIQFNISKLKGKDNVDLFEDTSAICISTGQEISFSML